jgi:hypothetical protein
MRKRTESCRILYLVVVISLCSGAAAANDGPAPEIFELLQQGEGVRVTLSLADGGEPGMGDPISLTRETDQGEVDLFEDQAFGSGDVVESYSACVGMEDEEWCAANPDDCDDCDGDEVLECSLIDGWCDTFNHVEVLDECVPAGMATYTVWEPFGTTQIDYDSASIEVEDVGQECGTGSDSDADSDADTDADSDTDGDADSGGGDDGGCSVVTPGAGSSPAVVLAVLLFLL